VVVAGSVGGAGATTTALVLGAALAEQHRRPVAVLDASPAGGDLVARVFGSVRSPVPSWQQWARGGAEAATLRSLLVGGTPSVVVLGADPDASDGGALLPAAIEAATAEGWLVVIDAGSGAVAAPGLAAALAADAALAIAVPARAGDATRARWFFSALAMRYGSAAVADAVVAVVEQGEESSAVFAAVSRGLAGKVAATVAIPTDPQLVTGLQIDPRGIADSARTAAGALAQALTHTNAAARRPAR
jgi:MinD-like ATPase involved in chromosome partitioning or flagellar assembly